MVKSTFLQLVWSHLLLTCFSSQELFKFNSDDKDHFCNRTIFVNTYVQNAIPLNQSVVSSLKQHCSKGLRCSGATITLIYVKNTIDNNFYFNIYTNELKDKAFQDCWGFLLEVNTDQKKVVFYKNFGNKSDAFKVLIKVAPKERYQIKLISLPSGRYSYLPITVPSPCENNVLDMVSARISVIWKNCSQLPSLKKQLVFASSVCKLFPNSKQKRYSTLTRMILVENCDLVLIRPVLPSNVQKPDDQQPLKLVIPLVLVSLLLVTLLAVFILDKVRKRIRREMMGQFHFVANQDYYHD